MSTAQMHSESASAAPEPKDVLCPVDGKPFVPARPWQKFCSTECRNTFHRSLTPEALRRDIDALRAQVDAIGETIAKVNRDADRRDAIAPEDTEVRPA